jgi:TIR domain/CHAT domain
MSSPLRVLAIVAAPRDAARFDPDAAWRDLGEALQPLQAQGLVALERVTPPTETALKKRLAAGAWDVVHFIGHATSRTAAQYGTLVLESSQGLARSVATRYLGQILQPVSIVVLQIQETLESAWEEGPAVLINAGPLIDPSHAVFARKFYASLATGSSVAEACAHARSALASVGSTRTLILHDPDGARVTAPPVAPNVPPPPVIAFDDRLLQELRRKRAGEEFDVFLCHNGSDKPRVRQLARELEAKGILPWLDERELPPGQPWQPLLERQIASIRAAAVFVGAAGVGPWQEQEMYGFLRAFVERKIPVIPVLLQDAAEQPELPMFLRGMTWVDFRVQEPDPLSRLIWGITGRKPET